MEPVGQDVDQEAANELVSGEPHDLLPIARLGPIILPFECHSFGVCTDQATVRYSDPLSWFARQTTAGQWMGISTQIGQHCLGAAEGWFGIDHPFDLAERREPRRKSLGVRQAGEIAEECQLT